MFTRVSQFQPIKQTVTPLRSVNQPISREHKVGTLVAPLNGLHTDIALASQDEKDALEIVNFFVKPKGLEIRHGHQEWFDELDSKAQTLLPFEGAGGSNSKLFAATLEGMYDVTTQTDNVSTPAKSLTFGTQGADVTSYWSHLNFSAAGTNYLCCVSPGNGYKTYDNAGGWVDHPAGVSAGEINGTSPTNFKIISQWKERLWMVKEDESTAWYLPVNSIAGAISEYDFGPMLEHGGSIAAITSWTLDGGAGIDDLLVIIGKEGDVVVYQGTDPDSASTFAIVGKWYIGKVPENDRFFTNFGGDLWILSESGMVSMARLLKGEPAERATAASQGGPEQTQDFQRINGKLAELISAYHADKGWQMMYVPKVESVIVKPPANNPSYADYMYVFHIHGKGWSTFEDLPCETLGVFNGQLFGTDSTDEVYQHLTVATDGADFSGTGGSIVDCRVRTGFTDLELPGVQKTFQMVAPLFVATDEPSVSLRVNTQFDQSTQAASPSYVAGTGAIWDTSTWDNAVWAGGEESYESWVGCEAVGYYGSLDMAVQGQPGTLFTHWRAMVTLGGFL
jgi:hypothetical protein